MRRTSGLLALILLTLAGAAPHALDVELLRSIGGLPPHIAGLFEDATSFQQSPAGLYYVFDRRGHAVYTIDPDKRSARKAVEIGQESGRIIQPYGFDVLPDGSFVVADAPAGRHRVQLFDLTGLWRGGFFLPLQTTARVETGNVVLSGVGSMRLAGRSLLVSSPERGSLFTEYSLAGQPIRSVGRLRQTGYESERDLHVAMNTGLPLPDPTGGFYYVFVTGRPMFRKYDASGTLVFERHVEGREIDELLGSQPTVWPRRRIDDREVPFVAPVIRTAAVDPAGRLWISLAVPYTYVYDPRGDKTRTVQFSAAGLLSPVSLSFTKNGRLLVTPGCYEFKTD